MRSFAYGAVALLSATALSACANGTPVAGGETSPVAVRQPAATSAAPASPAAEPTRTAASQTAGSKATTKPEPESTKVVKSDLSALKSLGIAVEKSVLIDVADDGEDRWLSIGKNGVVDFTGTKRTDNTMMFLAAAPVAGKNRVVIKPPFYNEDLGGGYCVADTKGAPLKLEECENDRRQQVFELVPAGDSGQFELHGMYGVIRVDNGKITTNGAGRVGLQTIVYAQ